VAEYPEKHSVLEQWFEGDHVLLHLDARREGVDVPSYLKQNHSLTLKLSNLFQGPTTWNDNTVVALLKFSGEYYRCIVPWPAIWGMTSSANEQRIWPEDLPTEVVRDLTLTKLREIGSRLLGIKRDKDKTEPAPAAAVTRIDESDEEPLNPDGTRKRKPTLRRIK